ncbi:response regulator PleD [Candidatus Magnetoovum chiemensis]|nr:response regulator PleD [Candidatus Magnetoovum chiemensis]
MKKDNSNEKELMQILKGISLLLVEDDEDIHKQLSFFLSKKVGTLYSAYNGEQGLNIYKEKKPDVIITDIRMPIMNGLKMARAIKEIDSNTPIIVTTAFNDQDYFIESIDIGVDKYVLKPTYPKHLLKATVKCAIMLLQKREIEVQNRYIHFILDSNPIYMITTYNNEVEYINQTFLGFLGLSSSEEFLTKGLKIEYFFLRINNIKAPFKNDFNWIEYIINNTDTDNVVYIKNCKATISEEKAFVVTHRKFPDSDKYIFTFTDISKIQEEKNVLRMQADIDVLTGIYNRKRVDELLEIEAQRAKRYQTDLSLIMFDIDFFKKVNDTYGHNIGDYVLRELTTIVKENIRAQDYFARWGGEEFMVLMPYIRLDNAEHSAERLRIIIQEHPLKEVGNITCSFGVTQFRGSDNYDTFTKRVDDALYEAKNNGRNKMVSK